MSFWATTLPYTDPGQFKGGIRTRDAVLNNLQADAFRSAAQNQVTDQVANARSGAAATNTRAATAEISQAATALNSKNIQLESHEQVLRTPLSHNEVSTSNVITTGTDLNDLINSDGSHGSNTSTAGSINGDQANDAHLLVTGDDITITGTEFDGTAIAATTFVYGTNGTTVGDLINFINGTGIGAGGGTDKFTTATMDLIGPGDDNNGKLRLVSDNGGPGMLSIDIDAPDAHVTTNTFAANAAVAEVATSGTAFTTGGGDPASAGTAINSLDQVTFAYSDNDEIDLTGTDANGGAIAGTFTFGAGNDGTTLGDILTRLNILFDAGANDVTLSVNGAGNVVMTADTGRALNPDLAFQITDSGGAGFIDPNNSAVSTQGRNPFISGTFTSDGGGLVNGATDLNTLTLVDDTNILNDGDEIRIVLTNDDDTASDVDFTYGAANDGTTINNLITFLTAAGRFDSETAVLTPGTPTATLEIESGDDDDIDLNLLDEGKHILFQDYTGPPSPDLLRLQANTEQSNFLARGSSNIAQDQGGDQDAFAELSRFDGQRSTAFNSLTQNAQVTQTFDVDLTTTVLNCTLANNFGAFDGARFRVLHATDDTNAAQAIFTNGQRQGSAADRLLQNAIANGADADNTRTMTATFSQTGDVRHTGIIDMTRKEQVALQPRSVDLLARYTANSAQNTSASSQEQIHSQNGVAGVNDQAGTTENGGDAQNVSTATLVGTDAVTVANISSVAM